jgi:hypothetical protein
VVFVRRVTATLQNKFRSLASFPSLAYSLASMHFVRLEESKEPSNLEVNDLLLHKLEMDFLDPIMNQP